MKEFEVVIQNQTGLHARPAKGLVNLVKTFRSDIRIQHGKKQANAKSLVSVLTLGVERGATIRVMIDGEDEEAARNALYQAIESGLGESMVQNSAPAPSFPSQREGEGRRADSPAGSQAALAGEPGILQGMACSPGIAIGPILRYDRPEIRIDEHFTSVAEECARLKAAVQQARQQLDALRAKMDGGQVHAGAAILEVHAELLDDAELVDAAVAQIQTGQSAAQAWRQVIEQQAAALMSLKDPLLAARAADLRDVGDRVLRGLVGAEPATLELPAQPVIIVAHELAPSDAASLDKQKVLGVCLAAGGVTSHTAIIARAMGLPSVVGVGAPLLELKDQTIVVVNGSDGTVAVAPDAPTLERARQATLCWQEALVEARRSAANPAVTRDGRRVEVAANIGGVEEASGAVEAGAEGIGLLRTEFLFLNRTQSPTEEEQFEVYSRIIAALQGRPVIVRTMDVGGDKPVPYLNLPAEANPFLGVRGLRLSLARPELLRQQLRAIYRAAQAGPTRIMFPMVADIQEWRAVRQIAAQARKEVNGPEVELGIMVEVPSTALLAGVFAQETDFFSIGTNDLTQYTLAMDRGNPDLANKSDGLHPAILRLIAVTVEAAHQAQRWVGICGELGSDPQAIPLLVGLGVDELSVNMAAIPTVKAQVRALDYAKAQSLAARALASESAVQVRALVMSAKISRIL